MSATDVQTEIIEPMQRLYLPPRLMLADVQTEALRGYADVLKGFSAADLKAGWTDVVTTHTTRSWPVPGVIVLATRKAAKERNAACGRPTSPLSRQTIDYTENRLRWEKIRCTQMARDAARAGCSWSLKCQVMNDGKHAEQIDLRQLISEHQSAERTANNLESGDMVWDRSRDKHVKFSDDQREIALKMWRNLLVQEAQTAHEIGRHT